MWLNSEKGCKSDRLRCFVHRYLSMHSPLISLEEIRRMSRILFIFGPQCLDMGFSNWAPQLSSGVSEKLWLDRGPTIVANVKAPFVYVKLFNGMILHRVLLPLKGKMNNWEFLRLTPVTLLNNYVTYLKTVHKGMSTNLSYCSLELQFENDHK